MRSTTHEVRERIEDRSRDIVTLQAQTFGVEASRRRSTISVSYRS